uniref:(California timema) hypothetical protein n=1 Tax=Timema californicum TaxID=61474 RepID=A0A7R9IW48_TIMCA|nr:unnamed protein product [Timema californicum]
MMASKLKTVNMEDNLDTSSSKKDEMQLGPEYLVKDKIKIEPMYSSPMASLVLSDSSQLTDDGFEKLPDQIMYPYAEPYDLQKHMEFNSIKYFDGAVKSEVQDIFEPSSKSGSPSAELEEKLLLLNNESQKSFQMKTVIHDKTSPGESCRVQLLKEREPELLTNEKMEQSKNNETGIVKPDTSRSEDPEFMNVDEGFQLLNASLTLIGESPVIEFVNMNIKLEVPEPSNDCVLPSTREENEMNLNSTKAEVDIFEPSSHYGFIFIKEEHEEVNKQNTASSQNSEEQVLGQNSSEYDDTKKQLMGFKCNEKDCYKQALRLGLCTAHGGGSKKRCSVDYVQHMEVAINVVKKIVLHELRKADYVQHTEVAATRKELTAPTQFRVVTYRGRTVIEHYKVFEKRSDHNSSSSEMVFEQMKSFSELKELRVPIHGYGGSNGPDFIVVIEVRHPVQGGGVSDPSNFMVDVVFDS